MFERYTQQARRAIFYARMEAVHREADLISSSHLLLGLAFEENSRSTRVASLKDRLEEISKSLGFPARPCSAVPYSKDKDLKLDENSKVALRLAADEADRNRHRSIDTDHLLCGILLAASETSNALRACGIDVQSVRAASKQDRIEYPPDVLAPTPWEFTQFAHGAGMVLKPAFLRLVLIFLAGLLLALILKLING